MGGEDRSHSNGLDLDPHGNRGVRQTLIERAERGAVSQSDGHVQGVRRAQAKFGEVRKPGRVTELRPINGQNHE